MGKVPGGFRKGREKTGGRKKGTKNKSSFDLVETAKRMGFEPAAELIQATLYAKEDYLHLRERGKKKSYFLTYANAPLNTYSMNAAKLMKFFHPELKSAEHKLDGDSANTVAEIFAKALSGSASDKPSKD